jgi:hypothetical protein
MIQVKLKKFLYFHEIYTANSMASNACKSSKQFNSILSACIECNPGYFISKVSYITILLNIHASKKSHKLEIEFSIEPI